MRYVARCPASPACIAARPPLAESANAKTQKIVTSKELVAAQKVRHGFVV
jgi:hypothetical protein